MGRKLAEALRDMRTAGEQRSGRPIASLAPRGYAISE